MHYIYSCRGSCVQIFSAHQIAELVASKSLRIVRLSRGGGQIEFRQRRILEGLDHARDLTIRSLSQQSARRLFANEH